MVRRVPLRSLGVFAKRSRTSPIFPHIPRHQPSSSFSTTFINNDASGPSTSFDLSGSGLSTINPSEISHFSRLSSQWWDPSGEFALLHRMNPCRIEYIRQIVALDRRDEPEWTFATRHRDKAREERLGSGRWLEGKRCLDVGCGGGLLSESLARLGGNVVGVDASAENIAIARLHATQDPSLPFVNQVNDSKVTGNSRSQPSSGSSSGRLEYRHSSAEALRNAGEKFDVVCAMEVLEHVDQPGEFMKCLGEMVKPGGHLILSTISRTPLSQLLTLTLAENILRLVTPGTHTYSKFVRPEELGRFVHSEMGGFNLWERNRDASDVRKDQVGETRGIVYDLLRGEWTLWKGAEGTWMKGLGEGCNYMFSAKKRKTVE